MLHELFTRDVLLQVAALAVCLFGGWLVGQTLRRRFRPHGAHTPTALSPGYLFAEGLVAALPARYRQGEKGQARKETVS
jgi:hypothetical protein